MTANGLIYTIAAILLIVVVFLIWQARRQIKERSMDADRELAERVNAKTYKEEPKLSCVCIGDKHTCKGYYLNLFVLYIEQLVYLRHFPFTEEEVICQEKEFRERYNHLMQINLYVDTDHYDKIFSVLRQKNLTYDPDREDKPKI